MHRARLPWAALGLILMFLAPPCAAGEPPATLDAAQLDALLARLEKKLGSVRSLRADFMQEKHLSIFTDVVRSRGVLVFQRPDAVRFEMTEPFESAFIAAGKAVAKYERIDGRWQKMRSAQMTAARMVTEQIAGWLEGRFRDNTDRYAITATPATPPTIVLTPRNRKFREFLARIELALSPDETHFSSVTIHEPGGDFTRMLFQNPRHNLAIPPSVFDTTGAAPSPLPPVPAPGAVDKAATTR